MEENLFDKLRKLKQLHDSGILTDQEFADEKAKILSTFTRKEETSSNKAEVNSTQDEKSCSTNNKYWIFGILGVAIVVLVAIILASNHQNNNYEIADETDSLELFSEDTLAYDDSLWDDDSSYTETSESEGLDLDSPIKADNSLTLDQVFCDKNVGKEIDIDYWTLVDPNGDGSTEEGPIAKAMINAKVEGEIEDILGPRVHMNGIIYKDYRGEEGTYYCEGGTAAGSVGYNLIWIYDRKQHNLHAITVD